MKASSLCALAFGLTVFYSVLGLFNDSDSKRKTSFLTIEDEENTEQMSFGHKFFPAITAVTEEVIMNDENNRENYFDGLKSIFKTEKQRNELNLLVLGDFGYLSGKEQPGTFELAEFLYNKVKKADVEYDFVLSVGDILYNFGVESEDDPNPGILFEEVFKMSQLGLDWYSVLGNHDCMGNLPATYALADKFPLWKQSESYYHRIFNIGSSNSKAAFVFLNGCELVCLTHDSPECYRGTLKNINFDILQDQVDWFENILYEMSQDDSIVWKIVVVHNGIFSAGVSHGDNPDLKKAILPLLVKYKVDVVLSGHDHNVQYLRMDLALEKKNHKTTKKDTEVNCPEGVKKDECIFGEFFHSELTECGIVKKETQINQLQSLYQKNSKHLPNLQGKRPSRESYSDQYEYLHQFIMGNGGTKMQKMCPYKQKDSEGNLRYGHTAQGLGDMRIREDELELRLISTKNEVLYSVKILREADDHSEL